MSASLDVLGDLVAEKRGHGALIRRARLAMHWKPHDLAERLHVSMPSVSRLENETQGVTIEMANALVSILPLSMEELLRAMGYRLAPPAASRLPTALVDALLQLTPEEQDWLHRQARAFAALRQMLPDEGQKQP